MATQQLGYNVSGNIGVLGIADSSGNWKYYSDYTAALANAKAGDTIVQFADIVEKGNNPIYVKNGVNINMNGFSFEMKNTSALGALTTKSNGGAATCSIMNGTIINNLSGKYSLDLDNYYINQGGVVNLTTNCVFIGPSNIDSEGSAINLNGGIFRNGLTCYTAYGSLTNVVSNSNISLTTYSTTIYVSNCVITGGGFIFSLNYGGTYYFSNCVVVNNLGIAWDVQAGYAVAFLSNCVGISTNSYAIRQGYSLNHANCSYISTANFGVYTSGGGGKFNNCFIYSSSNQAIGGVTTSTYYNCNIIATSNTIDGTGNNSFYNCILDCQWNNSLGHAVQNASSVVNCFLKVAHSQAVCINATTSKNITYINNTFQGSQQPIGNNVIQAQQNTMDLFDNVLIG